ncbi:MAG TPA: AmmeMemoRadiSam system protein A [Acidobacteriota bacterium]|nr:AmmeMemoRadiSam system protein A [Acidobacteriota bacterium]
MNSSRFDPLQRSVMIDVARNAIGEYLEKRKETSFPNEDYLQAPGAAFVTLKIDKELRGCIGATEARLPLGQTIVQCAIGAAFRDPRFPPLTREEYSLIGVELSILSPMRRIANIEEIEIGLHGIMMTHGMCRGLLLPQVAVEQQWSREVFLRYTCQKAGLPTNAWQLPGVKIEIFSAEIFGEQK